MSSSNKKKFRLAKEQAQRFARDNPEAFINPDEDTSTLEVDYSNYESENEPAYCVECDCSAAWVKKPKSSNSATELPYCKSCAKHQPDFKKSDENFFWQRL